MLFVVLGLGDEPARQGTRKGETSFVYLSSLTVGNRINVAGRWLAGSTFVSTVGVGSTDVAGDSETEGFFGVHRLNVGTVGTFSVGGTIVSMSNAWMTSAISGASGALITSAGTDSIGTAGMMLSECLLGR